MKIERNAGENKMYSFLFILSVTIHSIIIEEVVIFSFLFFYMFIFDDDKSQFYDDQLAGD